MNDNDMDRYYWRTGQRWSGDDRHLPLKISKRAILLLYAAFAVTVAMLYLMR
jgi:hypothetical protein